MLFNTTNKIERRKMFMYIRKLIKRNGIVEVISKNVRTINQNSYVHVLFALYGIENGYTIDEAKTLVKRELKYYYEKNNQYFLVKTSTMTTKELTVFIDKFRNWSAQMGCYLPTADEHKENYVYYNNEIEKNQKYLQ